MAAKSNFDGFPPSSSLTRLPSDLTIHSASAYRVGIMKHANLVTFKGGVIALNPGNSILLCGFLLPVRAYPTAPEEWISPLWNRVTGRPVMNGVEEAIKPNYVSSLLNHCLGVHGVLDWTDGLTFVAEGRDVNELDKPSGALSEKYTTEFTSSGLHQIFRTKTIETRGTYVPKSLQITRQLIIPRTPIPDLIPINRLLKPIFHPRRRFRIDLALVFKAEIMPSTDLRCLPPTNCRSKWYA